MIPGDLIRMLAGTASHRRKTMTQTMSGKQAKNPFDLIAFAKAIAKHKEVFSTGKSPDMPGVERGVTAWFRESVLSCFAVNAEKKKKEEVIA